MSDDEQQEGLRFQPWAITLAISLLINIMGAVYITATVVTQIEALSARIDRLERQIDSISNVTRGARPTP